MQAIPPWYHFSREFSYIFHSTMDILYLLFGLFIIGIVSRNGWRHHLCWAILAAAASVLSVLQRLEMDVHHYFKMGSAETDYLTAFIINIFAGVVSLYSLVMLWRTLRDLSRPTVQLEPLTVPPAVPSVWPPPPNVRS